MHEQTNTSFSQLVVQYERLVYTVCFQLVRDAAAAEDLTQESFLSAYLHRDAIPAGYERQWLCRVASNKAKDYLQSAYQRHTLLPGEENIPPGLSPPAEETALLRAAAEPLAATRDGAFPPFSTLRPFTRLEAGFPAGAVAPYWLLPAAGLPSRRAVPLPRRSSGRGSLSARGLCPAADLSA